MRMTIFILALIFVAGCNQEKEARINYLKQGYMQLDRQNFVDAKLTFEKALMQGEDSSKAYIGLSLVKTRSFPEDSAAFFIQNFKEAIPLLTEAIKRDSLNPYGFALRGESKLYSHDYEGAIRDYERLVIMAPQNPGSFFFLGKAKFESGDFQGAINTLSYAIGLDSTLSQSFYIRGRANDSLGNYNEAISDYNFSAQLDSGNARVYVGRGKSFLQINETKNACSNFSTAKQLGSESANQLFTEHCK